MLDGGTRFEVACKSCAVRLCVDRLRDAEAPAMAEHLREWHPELRVGETCQLGEVLNVDTRLQPAPPRPLLPS